VSAAIRLKKPNAPVARAQSQLTVQVKQPLHVPNSSSGESLSRFLYKAAVAILQPPKSLAAGEKSTCFTWPANSTGSIRPRNIVATAGTSPS
jgi:hypothetical protein